MKANNILEYLSQDPDLWWQETNRIVKQVDKDTWEAETKRRATEAGLKEGFEKGMKDGLEKGMKDGLEKGLAEGKAEGIAAQNNAIVTSMLKNGLSCEIIAQYTGLDIEIVRNIADKN